MTTPASMKSGGHNGARISVLDRPLRILHLEDSPDDRRMIQSWLQNQNIAAEFMNVDNRVDFVKALGEAEFDIILSDKHIPGYDGTEALRFVRENFPKVPFVFVTGSLGEEAAIETIKHGATDYVLKDRLSRLIPAVERAVHEAEQQENARQIEEKNREQAALLEKAQDAILVTDADDNIQYWNTSAERIYGWEAQEAIGQKAIGILSRDPVQYQEVMKGLLKHGNWTGEMIATNRNGDKLTVESRWTLVRNDLGNAKSILIIDTDITEKKNLEARFLRSQRLDSIGALAGGIAHDLNNALAPVIMSTELLKMCESTEERDKFLDIIQTNARRATELVKQILSFARGSGQQRGPVQINHLIKEMGRMIKDTFPKSVVFTAGGAGAELWAVEGDSTEIHQVLLNLCVNARDAMPNGGQLKVSAKNVRLTPEDGAVAQAAPGPYVMLSVADTGTGIPPEVLPRIFEPFFTTKQGDKGTGLGLATVSSIVKHHKGFLQIQTERGQGTEFKVYFPATGNVPMEESGPTGSTLPLGRGEMILVIDDEETLLELTKTMLETFGYRVITAQNGLQGVEKFKDAGDIRLLVTDSDMPQLDGDGTIRAIKALKPDLPVIVTSGAKRENGGEPAAAPGAPRSLAKPYSLEQLLIAIDGALHN